MSRVCNAVLSWGLGEDNEARLKEIADALESHGFVDCEDPALPSGWYGGTKCLECQIAIGAFNHIGPERLWAAVEAARWNRADAVCLMWKDQEDNNWSMRTMDEVFRSNNADY